MPRSPSLFVDTDDLPLGVREHRIVFVEALRTLRPEVLSGLLALLPAWSVDRERVLAEARQFTGVCAAWFDELIATTLDSWARRPPRAPYWVLPVVRSRRGQPLMRQADTSKRRLGRGLPMTAAGADVESHEPETEHFGWLVQRCAGATINQIATAAGRSEIAVRRAVASLAQHLDLGLQPAPRGRPRGAMTRERGRGRAGT